MNIQIGGMILDVQSHEIHRVLEIQPGNYLLIQYEAMFQAEMEEGKNIISAREIDGVCIKLLGRQGPVTIIGTNANQ